MRAAIAMVWILAINLPAVHAEDEASSTPTSPVNVERSGKVSTAAGDIAKPARDGSRFVHLEEQDPYWVGGQTPRLTTPMWIGENGVEAAVILSIDDMRDPEAYERYLRPLLNQLHSVAGRAPVSIFTCRVPPASERLQQFLREGLTIEIHTVSHPCPLMRAPTSDANTEKQDSPAIDLFSSNLVPGEQSLALVLDDYLPCIDNMAQITGNSPVAFRMPCCDSQNTNTPRFYSEVFSKTTREGKYLGVSSSVFVLMTAADPELEREWVVDADGRDKFKKYVPFRNFGNLIESYPFPYVVGNVAWEFPCAVPSDWSAQHLRGVNHEGTVEDWKSAVNATVKKQGLFTLVFHPHQWIKPEQLADLVATSVARHGGKIRFLNFRDVQERLTKNLLAGEPLRSATGGDNGVRLLDVNHDGFMDVVIGNSRTQKTRVWQPKEQKWFETSFPTKLVNDQGRTRGVKFFGGEKGNAGFMIASDEERAVWQFDGREWISANIEMPREIDGAAFRTMAKGVDPGVRLRDVDGDGMDDLLIGNPLQNAVFLWAPEALTWKRAPHGLPETVRVVDARGGDAGLRFRDLDGDGDEDLVYSNEREYAIAQFVSPREGWRIVKKGNVRNAGETLVGGAPSPMPMIAFAGRPMGAWFHGNALFVANEFTAKRKDLVDTRTFRELLSTEPMPVESQ
ncbi:MAG: VCBS repeat-containing protein [Planctomycetota bacterium]